MSRVQVKAGDKASAAALCPVARKIRSYFETHPISTGKEVSGEIVQCNGSSSPFVYDWVVMWEDSVARATWQAQFDVWLRTNVYQNLPKGVQALMIRFLAFDDVCMQYGKSDSVDDSGFIRGEGLVSFKSTLPRYSLNDLIVDGSVMQAILSAVAIVRHADLIYREWGFDKVEPQRRMVLNFYGPPGTGKTMAAHGLAQALSKKIVVANFAEIESKYVGDSPKNLENIFRRAEIDDAVLFFDEADSFLGSRITNISSSSDQAVNSLRSKLLQLLEDFSGVVVFCTNLVKNYDKAFESRILSNIKFDYPGLDCRCRLIRQKIPCQIPFQEGELLDDEGVMKLATLCDGFAGREIKNAILKTLCKVALSGRRTFRVDDFADGIKDMQAEVQELRMERKDRDNAFRNQLSGKIKAHLEDGDYAISEGSEKMKCLNC